MTSENRGQSPDESDDPAAGRLDERAADAAEPRAEAAEPTHASVGLRSERGPILLAVMVTTALIAMDATILATAVPSIVEDLHDFDQFPWLFSIYLLAQAVSVPVYGKLSDTIGRKPIMLIGVVLFSLASIGAGLAWNMGALIAFRLIQGLGAGAVGPMGMTIIGDIYTVQERAKVQGYVASVWAASSVIGPTLGGLFAQFGLWRWIFFINIPLGIWAAWLLIRDYHEHLERQQHRIDHLGGAVLTLGLTAFILGVLEADNAWPLLSWQSAACAVVALVSLAIVVPLERRVEEPILDLDLLRRPILLSTTVVSFGVGAILQGVTSFVPTYLEKAGDLIPVVAGLAVATITIGWPIAAGNAGRLYLTRGFRFTVILGTLVTIVGAVLLWVGHPWPQVLPMAGGGFVVGVGLGLTAAPSLIAAQDSVDWGERGVVTAVNVFARSAGSALGVAVLGAISHHALSAGAGENDPPTMITATGQVFLGVIVAAVLMALAALGMPRTHHSAADAT